MPNRDRTFGSDFRRFFGRGLAILLPSILTLWILWYAFAFVFNNVAVPINRGIRWGVVQAAPMVLPEAATKQPGWYVVTEADRAEFLKQAEGKTFRDSPISETDREIRAQKFRALWQSRWYLSGTGLVVAIVLIYLAGMVLGGLIGRRVYSRVEGLIARIPGFKQVYPHVKQVVNLIMGEQPMAFKRVVLVEYPRQGVWSVGLVTSASLKAVAEQAGSAVLSVFIPSTPTPFTGFVINVPESQVVDLPLSVDEAIRFLITGGVLIPEHQKSLVEAGDSGAQPLPVPGRSGGGKLWRPRPPGRLQGEEQKGGVSVARVDRCRRRHVKEVSMRIEVIGRNLEVTEAIREHTEGKAQKLTKFYDGIQAITVRLSREDHQHHGKFGVELVIDVEKHDDFISHEVGEDLYASIDSVIQKGSRQLSEFKAQLKNGKKRAGN